MDNMSTSKLLFPAMNELYELGFDDKQLAMIDNFPESLNCEAQIIKDELVRDISFICMNTKTLAIVPGRTTSLNSQIQFYKLNETKTDSDNEDVKHTIVDTFKSACSKESPHCFYVGYSKFSNTVLDEETVFFLFKKLELTDIPDLTVIHDFFRSFCADCEVLDLPKTYESVADLKDTIKEHFLNSTNTENINFGMNEAQGQIKEICKNLLNLLWPNAKHTKLSDVDFNKKFSTYLDGNAQMCVITDVVEVNNFRFFLGAFKNTGRWGYNTATANQVFQIIGHTNPLYDHVDVGRLYLIKRLSRASRDTHKPLGVAVFLDDYPNIPLDTVLRDYIDRQQPDDETNLLTNNAIALLVSRYEKRKQRDLEESQAKTVLTKKIKEKLNTLTKANGKLKINDVTYTQKNISYENQILQINSETNWVYELLKRATNYYSLERINFDYILDQFLQLLTSRNHMLENSAKISGLIGNVSFLIEKKELVNRDGITSYRTYINNIRINTEEVRECIHRGLCFNKQNDFAYFLKEVSKCSLKIHRFLQIGINSHPQDSFTGARLNIKLVLERFRNINYLMVDDSKFKVKDTHKLTTIADSRNLMDVINIIMNPKIVEGVEIKNIKAIIESAKKEYITAIDKSKELLRQTEELFNLKINNYRLNDSGKTITGYKIKGKLRTYLLEVKEASDGRNSVYDANTGKYICIVDKSTAQVGKDKLVNRIFALHNDSLVATQVTTLES